MRLPDRLRSRAVLVGTSRYQSDRLPDLPSVRRNITDFAALLTSDRGVGIPSHKCATVLDATDAATVGTALQDAADDADDLLLVYYAGHGVLDDQGRLYLALATTAEQPSYRWTAFDISHIREVMAKSGAANRVLILDCCFSGRAYEAMGGSGAAALATAQVEIKGTYTLTSTSANTPAHAPVGQRYTTFTGTLLELLEHGVPDGPELLSLDDIYSNVRQMLRARGAPEPGRSGTENAQNLALVRNRRFAGNAAVPQPVPTVRPIPSTPESPRRRPPYGWRKPAATLTAVAVLIGIVTYAFTWRSDGSHGAASMRPPSSSTPPPATSKLANTIEYEAISADSAPLRIYYHDGDDKLIYVDAQPSPWTMTVDPSSPFTPSMSAVTGGSSALTCRITVGGHVQAEQTHPGPNPAVVCGP